MAGPEMKVSSFCPLLICVAVAAGQPSPHKVILLDAYHNQEPKQPTHYRWEGTNNGGFSELGNLLHGLGAELRTTTTETTSAALIGVNCLIIVDPDTPAESDHPHYISRTDIDDIVPWVEKGGRLVLLGNNEGNAEFEHFNRLASRFGFTFVNSTIDKNQQKAILTLTGNGAIFAGSPVFYAVDVAPIKVEGKNVKTILAEHGVPVMVLEAWGSGLVFGLGDPWVYNEYIHRNDNAAIATKLFRMLLQ
jgi:unsaturated rhamnogalacturonyl hydrolase